jgi:hypothetical protein
MNPWSDDESERPPPRRPGLGCLLAAIICAVGLLVVLVLGVKLIGSALSGVEIR